MSHYTPTSPEVSVLMVSHDAEGTIRRAVESLQNQTFRNFELVVVDAGSTDATPRLLDALAERDLRLVVVQTERVGRSRGLDLALSRARGAFLLVMDADGWAEPTLLADLLSAAEKDALDLVVDGFSLSVSIAGGRATELVAATEAATFSTQHDFRSAAWQLFAAGQLLPASAKLFSREKAEEWGARFDPSAESDHSFVTGYLREVQRVGVLGDVGYHVSRSFTAAEGAAAGTVGYRLLEEEHTTLLSLYRHWGLEGDVASMEMLQSRYVEQLAGCVEGVCGWGSSVPSDQQRGVVSEMIGSERAQLAASIAHPRSNSARAMLAPIRSRNASLACVQARLLSLLRRGSVADVVPDVFV